jgi:hypothetical protein
VQQSAGNSALLRALSRPRRRTLARRRMLTGLDLWSLLDDAVKSGDAAALDAGFLRMWQQAWAYITDPKTPAERARRGLPAADPEDVSFLAITKMRKADFAKAHPFKPFDMSDYVDSYNRELDFFKKLPQSLRASRLVDALQAVYPELKITATNAEPVKVTGKDLANVKKLGEAADKVFATIASGREDESIGQVFGTKNVAKAKRKYAAARKLMNKLVKTGQVVTDPSGYSEEEGVGGRTKPGGPIELNPAHVGTPDDVDSIRTMIHESLHAANSDVDDLGYIGSPGFTTEQEVRKLDNAAHFEVVPLRILARERHVKIVEAYDGQVFVPAAPVASKTGGSTAPANPPTKLANDTLEVAWNVASQLHRDYLSVFNEPTFWDSKILKYKDYLPFWSKVENLTIHQRLAQIDPGAAVSHKAKAPVNAIDIAISEEVVRDLGNAMDAVPKNDAEVAKLVAAARLPDALAKDRMSTPEKQRDLIIELVCGTIIGGITGTGARDLRVVSALAATRKQRAKIEQKRPPSDFAD